jgi:hypothetical protein
MSSLPFLEFVGVISQTRDSITYFCILFATFVHYRVQLKVEEKDEAQALVFPSPLKGERGKTGSSAVKEKPRETTVAQ